MEIQVHPEAQRALDREADQLLELSDHLFVEKATPAENFLVINGWSVPIDFMWQHERIAGAATSKRTGVAFAAKGKMIRIEADQFIGMMKFVEKVQSRREFEGLVSVEATGEQLIRWIQERLKGSVQTPFVERFQQWVQNNVTEHLIVFPIYELVFAVDIQLSVDGVEIRTLTHSELNSWFKDHVTDSRTGEASSEADKWRVKIGNRAAAFVKVRAEPTRAQEIAYEKVDRVLAVLRSYSPTMLSAQSRSHCTVYGTEHIETLTTFVIGPDGLVKISQKELGGAEPWHLKEAEVRSFVEMSFYETCSLLELDAPSEFQSTIISALMLYSRAGLEQRVESKLLYVLSALESLLLMSNNEPISANLARRFGYFVGDSLQRRRAIRDRIRKVYDSRSQFVHHGQKIEALLLIDQFLEDVWWFFRLVVREADRYKDKTAFLSALEDEMLTGSLSAGGLPQSDPQES
jgi:hypothetical protein